MYKVFVDDKPIAFVESDGKLLGTLRISENEVRSFPKDVQEFLCNASLDNPLKIVCSDPSETFQRVFKNFLKIEAAGGIVRRKSRFLVIKRKGLWDIPKGKIDEGEFVEEAAIREIEEECGINGPVIVSSLAITYHIMTYKGKKALKRTFWFMMKYDGPKETNPQLEEGITKVKWMTEEQMLGIRGKTFGSVNDVLDAYVRKYSL